MAKHWSQPAILSLGHADFKINSKCRSFIYIRWDTNRDTPFLRNVTICYGGVWKLVTLCVILIWGYARTKSLRTVGLSDCLHSHLTTILNTGIPINYWNANIQISILLRTIHPIITISIEGPMLRLC